MHIWLCRPAKSQYRSNCDAAAGTLGEKYRFCASSPQKPISNSTPRARRPTDYNSTITKQPTIIECIRLYCLILKPAIVIEKDAQTIFEGLITDEPDSLEYISERTSGVAYVQAFITTVAQTIAETLNGKLSEIPLPDSTCLWTCSRTRTTPSPDLCGQRNGNRHSNA